jgi:hypothetical protein
MDSLQALLRLVANAIHLSPLDLVLAFLIVVLTFACHIMRLIRMAGDEALEFVKWLRWFRSEWTRARNDLGDSSPYHRHERSHREIG